MTIQVECDELESQTLQSYANYKGISVSKFLLETALEEIEDKLDCILLEKEALNHTDENLPNISHEELGKMLGLR